jgi:NAD(P)-dependent dehydrogenase (short-subunit alcohol dehydrogenase family)
MQARRAAAGPMSSHEPTSALALQLVPYRIRVNAIAPGLIRTPASAPVVDVSEIINPVMENVPLGRPGEPDDVAALAVLLASPGDAFITGQTINDDGSRSLGGKSAREMIQSIGRLAQQGAQGDAD